MVEKKSRILSLAIWITLIGMLYMIWIMPNHVKTSSAEIRSNNLETGQANQQPESRQLEAILGIYVLAYDNNDQSPYDLQVKYDETVESLRAATESALGASNKTAIILADLGEADDTHILIAQNGILTPVVGLLDADSQLDPSLVEYDVTDGKTLGRFLVWARQQVSADKTIFAYIGHGGPVIPHTDIPINQLLSDSEGESDPLNLDPLNKEKELLSPLPSKLNAHPSYTDQHAPTADQQGIISPHALATALDMATSGGTNPIEVLDLLHCFAASIDELYELSPYAVTTVGSPNYAFFDPTMPGRALERATASETAQETATNTAILYDGLHPAEGHPHVIAAFDNRYFSQLVQQWHSFSAFLMDEFEADPAATSQILLTAYENSTHYDTTVCDEDVDWQLGPPDALVDLSTFSAQLAAVYQANSTLTSARQLMTQAILINQADANIPYFDESVAEWPFLEEITDPQGISLFTPFVTTQIDGVDFHPWQALWYTRTQTINLSNNVNIGNPSPFQFIAEQAEPTWGDVVYRYWEINQIRPGLDVDTAFCTPGLVPFAQEGANLVLGVDPARVVVDQGETVSFTVTISNTGPTTATNSYLEVTIGPGLTFLPEETSAGCESDGGDAPIICQVGDLAVGSTDSRVIRVQALGEPTVYQLEFGTFSDNFDRQPENNLAIKRPVQIIGETPTPTPDPTQTATIAPSVTPSPSASSTPNPSSTPSATPMPSMTPSPNPTGTPSATESNHLIYLPLFYRLNN